MNPDDFGPFTTVVAIACALVATFSVLLTRMIGAAKDWTWLAGGQPSFLVTAGPRILAVALMAATYVTIDTSNYGWFGGAAVVLGIIGFGLVAWFDRLRRQHVLEIPLVGTDGDQLRDEKGRPQSRSVVVGLERDLMPTVKRDLQAAREQYGGVSLAQFMSGYGTNVNDPSALWDSSLLARVASKLTIALMFVVLVAVMTLFLAAFVIDAANRAS